MLKDLSQLRLRYFCSKSCAILYSYNAIAIATAKPFDAPPEVIPKFGVIFFIVPPSSTKTKSASLLDVVVVGVSELLVVIIAFPLRFI